MQPQQHRFLVRNQPWAQAEQGARQGEATFVDVIHALLKLACWEAGAFGFRTAQPREEARLDILRLCGASIQGILEFVQRTEACQQLTASTVELETQIAESKIAESKKSGKNAKGSRGR